MADMKLVDMARPPEGYDAQPVEPSPYPCGLRISLYEEDLKKLGIDMLPELGTKCAFYICGEVVSTSESSEGGEYKCMGVQIQQMAPEELPEDEETEDEAYSRKANTLYGKAE